MRETVTEQSSGTHDATMELIRVAEKQHLKPLWAQMAQLNPPLPNPKCIPHVWEFEKIRPHLLKAGELVTEKQAERRVLMLVNPARGTYGAEAERRRLLLTPRKLKMRLIQQTRSTVVCSWSCREKPLPPIDTLPLPAGSSSRATVALPPSTAAVSACKEATLS